MDIIKGHRGFIDIKSKVGTGTTFEVYLPAGKRSKTEQPPAGFDPNLTKGAGECILIVDDESSIREIVKESLECYGYAVLTASNGAEAVATLAREIKKVSAIITDIQMPKPF